MYDRVFGPCRRFGCGRFEILIIFSETIERFNRDNFWPQFFFSFLIFFFCSSLAGSVSQMDTYVQFAGTVFVRKAVIDHMVLTFCSPGRQLYSLVVARNRTLDGKELKSIKGQMKRIKLPVLQTKLACRNSSSSPRAAAAWPIAALCLAVFRAVK